MTAARRTLTPFVITERYQNFRTGRLEIWAAESKDGLWKYRRIEDTGTPWVFWHVPTGIEVDWRPSLPKARAATADGTAARRLAMLACSHPQDQRSERTERGTWDYHYEDCGACGGFRPLHGDDDRCQTCWDYQGGYGPGHEWCPAMAESAA